MAKQLVFALDYDNTFTACPHLWVGFVRVAKLEGHSVVIVTSRRSTEKNVNEINDALQNLNCRIPVVFAELGSKLRAVEKRGVAVDIWIDDDPKTLVDGH